MLLGEEGPQKGPGHCPASLLSKWVYSQRTVINTQSSTPSADTLVKPQGVPSVCPAPVLCLPPLPELQEVSLSHFTDEEMKARGWGNTPNSWDTDLSPDPRLFPLQSACPLGHGSREKERLHSKPVAELSSKDYKREEGRREVTAQMEGAAPAGSHQVGLTVTPRGGHI